MEITNIYEVRFQKDNFAYVGTLRNEKRFSINDTVWFSPSRHQGQLFMGEIIGVELPPAENPEYIYKVRIPKLIAQAGQTFGTEYPNVTCDSIFTSISEARDSAEKNCKQMYELQMKEIERYFEQYVKS